nr:cyclophilin-like fold protein [Butyrivibrio sp.]
MNRLLRTALLGGMLFSLALVGCGSKDKEAQNVTIIGGADGPTSIFLAGKLDAGSEEQEMASDIDAEETEDMAMTLTIDGNLVPVIWEDNASVQELEDLCPLTVSMSMYGGFEQVGSIGQRISRDDKQMTTVPGDVVLYSGNQIVVFYGSNSWAYTRLGHVDLSEDELTQILGNGDVTLVLQ